MKARLPKIRVADQNIWFMEEIRRFFSDCRKHRPPGSIVDRRTYTFIVASAAFLFFYLSLRAMIAPPVNPNQPVAAADGEIEENPEADKPDADEPDSIGDGTANADEDANGIASTSAAPKWFTLGSMNPGDGYDLLIYFANQGGAIERIEITARDDDGKFEYRRVDTQSGYLGYFAGQSSERFDGVKVNVVAPGSPASLAQAETGEQGIEVGDVILAVDGTPVLEESDITAALLDSKPGETIKVEIARGSSDDAATSPLLFEVTLTEHPLDLVRLAKYGGDDQIKGNLSRLSCLMTLARVGTKSIRSGDRSIKGLPDPESRFWDAEVSAVEGDTQTISFETTLGTKELEVLRGEPIRMRRSFSIAKNSYAIEMEMELANLGERVQELAYRLDGPNGVTPEGWWYSVKISPNFGGAAARDVVYRTEADGHELVSGLTLLKQVRKDDAPPYYGIFASDSSDAARSLDYIGVDAQYFAVGYLPPDDETDLNQFDRCSAMVVADPEEVKRHKERAVNVSFFLESVPEVVAPGESVKQKLRIYAGPKNPEVLEKYAISDFVYYGWFAVFSKPLSALLHFLQSIVGNYAIAIILLTVIVRGVMFPISRNAAVNAQKMQELAPEMKKIAEKYKDDMEGRLKAQQALQKRVGFNPLAGCLPMFLQLPIFMGLYRALSVDIELRQKPVWSTTGWASNLAAPDQFYFWADWMPDYFSGRGTGWLGPYFNLLPIVVVVLFITQQKLFMPPATDEQTRMTQKVMTFMTLFMGLFFFRVPAGLCIYFVASSLWGIGERLIVKRTLPQGKHFDLESDGDGLVIDAAATSTTKSKPTLTDKLLERVGQKEPERTVLPPNKRKRPGGGGKKKR